MLIVALVLAAFLIGMRSGFNLTCWALRCAITEGRWDRETMAKFVSKWRGPDGERWDDAC